MSFWQFKFVEMQNHSYWICFLLYIIFICIHNIKFGLFYVPFLFLSEWKSIALMVARFWSMCVNVIFFSNYVDVDLLCVMSWNGVVG